MLKTLNRSFLGLAPVFILWVLGGSPSASAQSLYQANYKVEVPLSIAGLALNAWGQDYLRRTRTVTEADFRGLSPNDINAFDRGAAKQDPGIAEQAHEASDLIMLGTLIAPLTLMLDNEIRSGWKEFLVLYVESQVINTTTYLASAFSISRKRPLLYNPDESFARKTASRGTDSFFSGHMSSTTTASFFMAKVYADYHPEANKYLLYGAASLPAISVAVHRYRAGKHFPTDLIAGAAVGVAAGVLTPEFHKKSRKSNMSLLPIALPDQMGLGFTFSF